jgi:hypothetical protein
MRHPLALRATVIAATVIAALAAAGAAQAASLPSAVTGSAKEISYGAAVLTGEVNPRGSNTSYYFQYGPTKAFGGQTTIADAGAGTSTVKVSLPVSGLQPLTVYYFRLVAVNSLGATLGNEESLLTTKIPLTLQILAAPDPVLYGGTITVQGTLSGTENDDRAVVLQANQFPFTAGFQDIGNPELTTASGGFSFPVLGLAEATQYRVVTTTSPAVISPVAVENVAVLVQSHVGRTRRHHFARIYGTVTPAEGATQVEILRIVHGHTVLVADTTLHPQDATSSSFSRVVRVKAGIYRVLVHLLSGPQSSNYGQSLLIR